MMKPDSEDRAACPGCRLIARYPDLQPVATDWMNLPVGRRFDYLARWRCRRLVGETERGLT